MSHLSESHSVSVCDLDEDHQITAHTCRTVFHLRNYSADLYEIWCLGTYSLNIARKRFESPGDIVHPPLKVTVTALTHSIVPLPSGRWKFCAY